MSLYSVKRYEERYRFSPHTCCRWKSSRLFGRLLERSVQSLRSIYIGVDLGVVRLELLDVRLDKRDEIAVGVRERCPGHHVSVDAFGVAGHDPLEDERVVGAQRQDNSLVMRD